MLPDSPSDRLWWAISESVVLFGIFLFWVAVTTVMTIAIRIVFLPVELLDISMPSTATFFQSLTGFRSLVVPLTVLTGLLYITVRGGTLLIDYYDDHGGQHDRQGSRDSHDQRPHQSN
ncbi:hypothetical protein C482_12724 [Natrialba chahannaoensis JCM 10990]|uniref:Uncharacterized protein n=1 Tax=Natrialba chahannaoensis JCM 10990 TaxID=1227492 RepID=M0AGJ4_9EURY|nr:hypothetical protein [Natrialba chahannaoensis]ELY97486.1 hypothetical protein C482_12724 [Natrialba chahannaoensis JCM 10990]